MITLFVEDYNPVTQDFYDKTIAGLQFHQLSCSCGLSGCLTIHGYYLRSLKTGVSKTILHICRVKCSHCGCTHALLLSSMVPYSQISLPDQVKILAHSQTDKDYSSIMDAVPSIDESTIRSVIRRFQQHWRQKLLAEQIHLHPLSSLAGACFRCFLRQFMQIKCTSNLLFLSPT